MPRHVVIRLLCCYAWRSLAWISCWQEQVWTQGLIANAGHSRLGKRLLEDVNSGLPSCGPGALSAGMA